MVNNTADSIKALLFVSDRNFIRMPQDSAIVQKFVVDVQTQGWDAKPFERVLDITLNQRELLPELVSAILAEIPRGGTYLDTAMSFISLKDYPGVVSHALAAYANNPENSAAESVVECAGLQCVEALHPHLRQVFESKINSSYMAANWPWRGSGKQDLQALRNSVENCTAPNDIRMRSWEALLETRDAACMAAALELAGQVPFPYPASQFGCDPVTYYLNAVGYHPSLGGLIQLYPDNVFHLQFPDDYIDNDSRPLWLRTGFHPSWKLDTEKSGEVPFGGTLQDVHGVESHCALCGGEMAHLITLAPTLYEIGVTDLASISLATCLSCLSWETEALYYQHDGAGYPTQVYCDEEPREPEFPTADVLKPCSIRLGISPDRWRRQDWGKSNGRENLNRVGGYPCWIQNAAYLACPCCKQTMMFLMQLDSNLPTSGGSEILWGSGGICYIQWCDPCKISALMCQCT